MSPAWPVRRVWTRGGAAEFDATTTTTGTGVDTTVGVLGGTGPMGRGLALRFAAAGLDVVVGSREAHKADEVVDGLRDEQPSVAERLTGAVNEDACERAPTVVIATPWEPALGLAVDLADRLADRTVVSVVNALTRAGGAFLPLTMPRGSVTAEIAARLPDSRVTGAFHHLPATPLADLDRIIEAEVLVVGDDARGRAETLDLVDAVQGLRGIDAGGLEAAGPVEAMTAVLVGINVAYRTHSTLRLGGSFAGGGPARASRAGESQAGGAV